MKAVFRVVVVFLVVVAMIIPIHAEDIPYADILLDGQSRDADHMERIRYVEEGCKVLPKGWLQLFLDDGWHIDFDSTATYHGEELSRDVYAGVTKDKTIFLYPLAGETTFCHEFAHFIQKTLKNDEEVASIFVEAANSGMRPYACSSPEEFWADFFANMVLHPNKFADTMERCPKATALVRKIVNQGRFDDVKTDSWYFSAVERAAECKVVAGESRYGFNPTGTVTWAEAIQAVYNIHGSWFRAVFDTKTMPVPINAQGTWYADAAKWAFKFEVVNDDTDFSQPITRAEMTYIIYRGHVTSHSTPTPSPDVLNQFVDKGEIPEEYQAALSWAVSNGVMSGTSGTTISPNNTLTRAEMACILVQYLDLSV